MIRLGRISYANMAPVFYRVDAEVRGGHRRPDRAQPAADRGRDRRGSDLVDRVRAPRRHAPAPASALRLERGRGRLDPARLAAAARRDRDGCGHPRVRDLGRPHEGAAAGGLARAARRSGRREAPDRRRGAQVRLRGSDSAPRSRAAVARAHGAADGLRGLGGSDAGPSRSRSTSRRRSSPRSAPRAAEPETLAFESAARYGYPAGFLARYFEKLRYRFGPRERAGLYTFLELARDVGELDEVPELRFVTAEASDVA